MTFIKEMTCSIVSQGMCLALGLHILFIDHIQDIILYCGGEQKKS